MRIDQLEQIVKLSEYGSISGACNELHLTPQSLSRSIKNIEAEIGVDLVERHSRGIRFTKEGVIFKEMAQEILEKYVGTLQLLGGNVERRKQELRGTLLLYTCTPLSETILNTIINSFSHKNLNVKIEVRDINNYLVEEIESDMKKVGVILTMVPVGEQLSGPFWDFLKTLKEIPVPNSLGKFYLCCSYDSPLAKQKEVCLNKIATYPCVRFSPGRNNIAASFESLFFGETMHKVSLYTTSKAAWFDAVKHNVGVGITFESFMWEESLYKDMFNDIAVLEITEKPCATISFFVNKETLPINSFIEHFMKTFV